MHWQELFVFRSKWHGRWLLRWTNNGEVLFQLKIKAVEWCKCIEALQITFIVGHWSHSSWQKIVCQGFVYLTSVSFQVSLATERCHRLSSRRNTAPSILSYFGKYILNWKEVDFRIILGKVVFLFAIEPQEIQFFWNHEIFWSFENKKSLKNSRKIEENSIFD